MTELERSLLTALKSIADSQANGNSEPDAMDEELCRIDDIANDAIASVEKSDNSAKLFAAAPDLLSALQDAVQDLQNWADDNEEPGQPFLETEEILAAARAAIAKAKES